jgi:hypothetical protein
MQVTALYDSKAISFRWMRGSMKRETRLGGRWRALTNTAQAALLTFLHS